ncbi:MAG: DUF1456 family protein [Gammaproteobacteria bacterium]|jgi:uncharacterized protein YehS (DUF1456 family)|nr:DUF1456 family protein [Gammaproteobacteria bacterium]MBT4492503.1 DUF1456 family protein [Gammaproteobacteria bacterium]
MKTNDCLRRIRYILDLSDNEVIAIFGQAEQKVSKPQVIAWLKKDDDPDYEECSDTMFATFLNGLIIQRRGRKDGPQPRPEEILNNNIIFRKLKIALNLQAEEILSILSLADLNVSKHELSAFFRRIDHKHYRDCEDQILRNFLTGLQIKYRETPTSPLSPG